MVSSCSPLSLSLSSRVKCQPRGRLIDSISFMADQKRRSEDLAAIWDRSQASSEFKWTNLTFGCHSKRKHVVPTFRLAGRFGVLGCTAFSRKIGLRMHTTKRQLDPDGPTCHVSNIKICNSYIPNAGLANHLCSLMNGIKFLNQVSD